MNQSVVTVVATDGVKVAVPAAIAPAVANWCPAFSIWFGRYETKTLIQLNGAFIVGKEKEN